MPRVNRERTVALRLVPARPYSLALTAERYTRFPEVVDRFDGRAYRRLLGIGRRGVLLSVVQSGPPPRALLDATLAGPEADSPQALSAARRVVEGALGAAQPVRGFYRAFAGDGVIGDAIRDFRGLRVAGLPSLWEALVTAILAQQVNLLFAYTIRRELVETFGRRARFSGELYRAFPEPGAFGAETHSRMRRFRLSDSKARAILGLAEAFAEGSLEEARIAQLDDETAIAALTALRGIGRWTAEIGLLRGQARPDIFPAGDLGVVKYLAQGLLGHSTRAKEDAMRRFAGRWKPWRSLALVYGYAELNRRKAARLAAAPAPPRPRAPESGRPRRR
jgi:DNA-3-methyladenine glycosylase II